MIQKLLPKKKMNKEEKDYKKMWHYLKVSIYRKYFLEDIFLPNVVYKWVYEEMGEMEE